MAQQITPEGIAGLFRQILLGRAVTAEKIPPFRPALADAVATATYTDSESTAVGVCVCDVDLVHRAGAALCLIPADSRLSAHKVDEALAENFQEILNICSQMFTESRERRIKLENVVLSTQARAPQTAAIVNAPSWRVDVKLTIAGYGSGRMSVFTGSR